MKRTMQLFLVMIISFIMIGCSQAETTTEFPYGYSDFSFYQVDSYNDQLNYTDGTYYIYYYSETCPACQAIKPYVLSMISGLNEDTLLLFDVYLHPFDVNPSFDVRSTPSLVKVTNNQFDELYVGSSEIIPVLDGLT